MKITDLRLYKVPPRWLFLAIDTDEGITGWGEPVVEGQADSVSATVKELSRFLINKNPHNINDIWNSIYSGNFYRGGAIFMSALAGIDQALWDIKGKHFGKPVYEMLGGLCHEKFKTYCWVGGDDPMAELDQISTLVAKGLNCFKMNACGAMRMIDSYSKVEEVVARIDEIRRKFGYNIDIALDFHGRVAKGMAAVMIKELEQFKPFFIEEPVLAEHWELYSQLAAKTSIPLAAGERSYSKTEFKHILATGGLSLIQPDLSHAGGITECLKIASMAEAYNVALAPHCPLGPIALASCLTVDFVSPNALIQENSIGIHYNQDIELLDYVINKDDFKIENNYIKPLNKPGLGVEINEDKVIEAAKIGHNWHNPIWRHADGSIAEW